MRTPSTSVDPVAPVGPVGLAVTADAAAGAVARAPALPRLSVIIPTWNEAQRLPAAIRAAHAAGSEAVEVIVADGGSSDATVAIAERLGCRVVVATLGRGNQLAAGVAAARGDCLLFLHADAILPEGYLADVLQTLAEEATALGAFRLRIDGRGAGLRWIEWCVGIRSRWFRMPYGDQALFVRKATYEALGGFRALPAMEDFDFVRRARHHGRLATIDCPVLVSARAWQQHGLLRVTLFNATCAFACLLGVAPDRVARWRVRHRRTSAITSD